MKLKWLLIIFGLSILIVAAVFLIKSLNTSRKSVVSVQNVIKTTPSPTPTSKPLNLDSCDIKAEENPLVLGKIEKFQEVLVGRFYGILHTFDLNPNKTEADIQLISPKGDQILPFHIKDDPGVIQDSSTNKHVSITALKPGFTVLMSFNCYPDGQAGQRFKITQFAITGKF